MNDGELILITGALLAGGLVASFIAVRLRVPSLVLFLGIGMVVGSDGAGWIHLAGGRGRAHFVVALGRRRSPMLEGAQFLTAALRGIRTVAPEGPPGPKIGSTCS